MMTENIPPARAVPPVTKVMIVDDHQAIIEMMTQVVEETIEGHRVVGVAKDVAEATAVFSRERPDLVILDLVLPREPGLSLVAELKKISDHARFLVFSGNLQLPAIRDGLAAGVLGFVEKASPLQEFRAAVIAVGAGQVYFDAKAGGVVRELVRPDSGGASQRELTDREKEVLRLMALGQSSKEIAQVLGVSIHTVINHRSSLMKKTGLHRVAQLSLYAVQTGLVSSFATPEGAEGR